ncbi:hypothetical protein A2642_01875 [Candidatus Nomurabacteria bacterium RIFCSPHIGHO2_01_FULL_39_10]|uniref:Uncharacterized protein n=1 Tax=Candidatus Nomurabacteria bacterium RIFCSPHIGHO2_01_FULL_39_10 TaxID=1801733 RepID=A0A1F6V4K4_9BACT|nr:MAG: hypothetical protein A2642_01875 [Candidatus Nomurabacteria bacterium RIFCSPHIGHO2_01_FULL_39_10]
MNKILFMVIVSVMMLQSFALVENSSPLSIQTAELKTQVEGKELIGLSGKLFGNEKVNVHVTADDGSEFIVGVETKDKKVLLVKEGGLEKPTLRIYTTEKVIREIMAAHEPINALQLALQDEKITYNAVGFFNKMKFSFISLFAKFGTKGLVNEKVDVKKDDKPVVKVAENAGEKGSEKVIIDVPAASNSAVADGKTISVPAQAAEKITANVVVNEQKSEEKVDAASEEKKPTMTKIAPAKEVDVIPEDDEKNEVVHLVAIRKAGFDPISLTVKLGDVVEWKNEREPKVNLNKAMIVGTQQCAKIKSKILAAGETFRWKADKLGSCLIVEGISAVQTGTLIVEK